MLTPWHSSTERDTIRRDVRASVDLPRYPWGGGRSWTKETRQGVLWATMTGCCSPLIAFTKPRYVGVRDVTASVGSLAV
jgi:hypothetical protein